MAILAEKEVSDFMVKIMPKNWHILTRENLKNQIPGHLYIILGLHITNRGNIVGEVHEMTYFEKVGKTTLCLFYEYQWQDTVLHELAHIAVNRWWSWKTKKFDIVNYGADRKNEGKRVWMHDKVFKRALPIFYNRRR